MIQSTASFIYALEEGTQRAKRNISTTRKKADVPFGHLLFILGTF